MDENVDVFISRDLDSAILPREASAKCILGDYLNKAYAGSLFERVRRVQLLPSILSNGCMHPSNFRATTTFRTFLSTFSCLCQNSASVN